MSKITVGLTLVLLAGVGPSSAGAQPNLLENGHFTDRLQIQSVQTQTCQGWSSATHWSTWIQRKSAIPDVCVESGVLLETDLLVGPLPQLGSPSAHLIHVRTQLFNPEGAGFPLAGIVQVFLPRDTGPSRVLASVWVYVVRGQAGMGVGNGGDTDPHSVLSSKVGEWEQLVTLNTVAPANEFVLYSTDPNGGEFYSDNAIVCPADTDAELLRCRLLLATTR